MKYLDHRFISNEFIKSLIETDNDEQMVEVVNSLEKEGLINKIELNDIYGIKMHDNLKEIIDEMESNVNVDYVLEKINSNTKVEDYEMIEKNKVNGFKEYYDHIKSAIEKKGSNYDKKLYIEVLEKLGKYEEKVLINFKSNLKIQEIILDEKFKFLPENHPDIATSYNNLGEAYSDLGETKKAIEFHEKSLAIRKICLPENHPDIATSYNNLGLAYKALGETKKAIEFYEKSLEIRKICLPANHPHIAMSYNNLGLAYSDLRETKKANNCFQQANIISQYNKQNIS